MPDNLITNLRNYRIPTSRVLTQKNIRINSLQIPLQDILKGKN